VQSSTILSEVEEEQEFERLILRMRSEIDISDRVMNRVPYFKCFPGSCLVDFLVDKLSIAGREEAMHLGQRWMDAGVFYHVMRSEVFVDGDEMYRFKVCGGCMLVFSISHLLHPFGGDKQIVSMALTTQSYAAESVASAYAHAPTSLLLAHSRIFGTRASWVLGHLDDTIWLGGCRRTRWVAFST
jgi:hypothetical protein